MQSTEEKFLQFQLEEEELALLPAAIAPEIRLVRSEEILPVPHLPDWVLGIYQWRDEMLWLVDLSYLLGYSPLSWEDKHYAIVIQIEMRSLGLVVPKVHGIEEYDWQQLQEPSDELFSPELMPFLQGFFLKNDQEILKLLMAKGIFLACSQKLIE